VSDSSPHTELFALVRRELAACGSEPGPIHDWAPKYMQRPQQQANEAHAALDRLEEQFETARADLHEVWDLIWNQDGPYIEGGDRMLDEWAQKVRPRYGFEASDPATSSEGVAAAVGGSPNAPSLTDQTPSGVSSPAKERERP